MSVDMGVLTVSDVESPEHKIAGGARPATQAEHAEVFGATFHLVGCPLMQEQPRPATLCLACPHFWGLSKIKVNGEASAHRRYRINCAAPRMRPLQATSAAIPGAVKDLLVRKAKARGWSELTLGAQREAAVFLDRAHIVNCPKHQAIRGSYPCLAPPCLNCEHYKGLAPNRRGLLAKLTGRKAVPERVLCAHPRRRKLIPLFTGEA